MKTTNQEIQTRNIVSDGKTHTIGETTDKRDNEWKSARKKQKRFDHRNQSSIGVGNRKKNVEKSMMSVWYCGMSYIWRIFQDSDTL